MRLCMCAVWLWKCAFTPWCRSSLRVGDVFRSRGFTRLRGCVAFLFLVFFYVCGVIVCVCACVCVMSFLLFFLPFSFSNPGSYWRVKLCFTLSPQKKCFPTFFFLPKNFCHQAAHFSFGTFFRKTKVTATIQGQTHTHLHKGDNTHVLTKKDWGNRKQFREETKPRKDQSLCIISSINMSVQLAEFIYLFLCATCHAGVKLLLTLDMQASPHCPEKKGG